MTEASPSAISGQAARQSRWPVLRSLQGYRPAFVTHDLVAGFTLVAIAIPEQLATSRLGGFSPQIGFFAFLAGSVAFALFGSNRFLSSGADSTITPIFAGGLALLATSGSTDYVALAGALALLVGVVLVLGGIFRLGWVADLLSIPVTVGFLAGISIHIIISQLPGILGLPEPGGSMLQRLAALVEQLPHANLYSLVIGFGVFALIMISERIDARVPSALIGLVLAAAATVLMGLEGHGVTVLGDIPVALPDLTVPDIAITRWLQLVPLALIMLEPLKSALVTTLVIWSRSDLNSSLSAVRLAVSSVVSAEASAFSFICVSRSEMLSPADRATSIVDWPRLRESFTAFRAFEVARWFWAIA